MKPLFTMEELRTLRRLDEGLERAPVSKREMDEAEDRDAGIAREATLAWEATLAREAAFAGGADAARGTPERAFSPGQPLLALHPGWLEQARAERFATTEEAARACGIGAKLMWILECGGVTSPEIARRVGRGLGLTRRQMRAVTCAGTAARRLIERREAYGEGAAEREGA